MKQRTGRARLGGCVCLAGVLLGGCSASTDVNAPASVEVSVQAEPEVALRTASLRVRRVDLQALPADGGEVPVPPAGGQVEGWQWPHSLRWERAPGDESPHFWLQVEALGLTGQTLATARLISSYRSGMSLEMDLVLRDQCLDLICGNPAQTCGDRLGCVPATRLPDPP